LAARGRGRRRHVLQRPRQGVKSRCMHGPFLFATTAPMGEGVALSDYIVVCAGFSVWALGAHFNLS
jgi:hypothetical protein